MQVFVELADGVAEACFDAELDKARAFRPFKMERRPVMCEEKSPNERAKSVSGVADDE